MKKYLKNHTIKQDSKRWKYKFDKLSHEELLDNFDKKFKIKKKGIKEKLSELRRRRNNNEEKYDSDDEEEKLRKLIEEEKERILADKSEKFFHDYEKKQNQNPFVDSDEDMGRGFGKKQKKDIKGMIKKILLYGGLPTLVVVSLGVLSNKKFDKKKEVKFKVSEKENRFKEVFVELVKKIILKRNKELDGMEKDSRDNEIAKIEREIRRQTVKQEVKRLKIIDDKVNNRQKEKQEIKRVLIADAAISRQLRNKSPSNPQQS
jgi:hypothetical protein